MQPILGFSSFTTTHCLLPPKCRCPLWKCSIRTTQLTQEPMCSHTNTHGKRIRRLQPCVTAQLPEPPASHDKHERRMSCQFFFPSHSNRPAFVASISQPHVVTEKRQSFSSTFTLIAARSMGNGSRFSSSVSCCAWTCRDVFCLHNDCQQLPLFKFTQQVEFMVFFLFRVRWNSVVVVGGVSSWISESEKKVRENMLDNRRWLKIWGREIIEGVFRQRKIEFLEMENYPHRHISWMNDKIFLIFFYWWEHPLSSSSAPSFVLFVFLFAQVFSFIHRLDSAIAFRQINHMISAYDPLPKVFSDRLWDSSVLNNKF